MSETWHILYLKVDDMEDVILALKQMMSSTGYTVAWDWPRVHTYHRYLPPPAFHFWISPAIRGWVSICREFPPLVATTKEIVCGMNCLAFECWIGEGNWGYLLYEGASVVDRFDSNPRQTTLYKYFFSEWWEKDSPYTRLDAKNAVEGVKEIFGGHPERLLRLPFKRETTPQQLRDIMDSTALRQTDIVDRLAKHIDLPNFVPQLLNSSNIQKGLYRLLHLDSQYTKGEEIAKRIEQIESFALLAFRPAPADKYREWARYGPRPVATICAREAAKWYEWHLRVAPPDTLDRLKARNELDALRALTVT